jgi:hypothetical protein
MFKNEAAYITIKNRNYSMKKLVQTMSCIVLLLFGTYIVLTGKTIYNVVNKKNVEQEISMTRTEIATLESDLFSYYNSIHKESLPELGFVSYTEEVYVNTESTFAFNQ